MSELKCKFCEKPILDGYLLVLGVPMHARCTDEFDEHIKSLNQDEEIKITSRAEIIRQKTSEFTEIGKSFEKHLPGWSLELVGDSYFFIKDKEGRKIHFNCNSQTKYRISGRWPYNEGRIFEPDPQKRMMISKARPIENAAKDIQRRFIPWFVEEYDKQKEKMVKQ